MGKTLVSVAVIFLQVFASFSEAHPATYRPTETYNAHNWYHSWMVGRTGATCLAVIREGKRERRTVPSSYCFKYARNAQVAWTTIAGRRLCIVRNRYGENFGETESNLCRREGVVGLRSGQANVGTNSVRGHVNLGRGN